MDDGSRVVRPFSRVVTDRGERGARPAAVVRTGRPVAVRRARRWTGLAVAAILLVAACGVSVAWLLSQRIARMEAANAALAERLLDRKGELERWVESARAAEAESKRTRAERERLAMLLTAAQARAESLGSTNEEMERKLADAEGREAQARANWAYAEGERDSLSQQLADLLSRIESVLERDPAPAVASPMPTYTLDPPPGETRDPQHVFAPTPP